MKTIQWYPGHMHKAQKEIRKILPQVDLIIEVLDSRIPFSSENPLIAELRGDKPCIKVLSKCDLTDAEALAGWQAYLEQERSVKTLPITTQDTAKMRALPDLCKKLVARKETSARKIRALIAGIPNVGKSTLINILAGRTIAKTGNEPAVTKSQQSIDLDNGIVLLDTPGILWPKQEYEKSSYRLAATGAIKDTAMEYPDVAFFAVEYLREAYPELLMARYELDALPEDEMQFFEEIGAMRGCLGRGGRVDLNKISELFINDLRSGVLGKVCLETPEMIETEKAIWRKKEEEKAALKEARLKEFRKGKRDS